MSLTAEFKLQSPQLPLTDVAATAPDLRFQLESAEQPRSGPVVFFIRVTGSSFNGVETALDESASVRESVLISEISSIRMYQIISDSPRPAFLDTLWFQKTFPESVVISPDGWRVKQQFTNRDEFTAYREFWCSIGFSFHLDRLYNAQTPDSELIGLSNKQREALLTAYEKGYFAVPQQTSLDDIAEILDISRSSLAERLHRAQAHLIEHFYYADTY
ncbi:helix-turn-helix domain-containing protein [Haladaptatus sp. CMAA 1911]|uniref:helix-turn-helix domain-containing protein n=1 Tax=unclassified Haladaptatus TaxID=2622732 RepID=UPI003754AE6A